VKSAKNVMTPNSWKGILQTKKYCMCINASSSAKAMVDDLPLRQPYCELFKRLSDSRNQVRQWLRMDENMDEWKIRFRREVKKEIAFGWSFCRNMKGI